MFIWHFLDTTPWLHVLMPTCSLSPVYSIPWSTTLLVYCLDDIHPPLNIGALKVRGWCWVALQSQLASMTATYHLGATVVRWSKGGRLSWIIIWKYVLLFLMTPVGMHVDMLSIVFNQIMRAQIFVTYVTVVLWTLDNWHGSFSIEICAISVNKKKGSTGWLLYDDSYFIYYIMHHYPSLEDLGMFVHSY